MHVGVRRPTHQGAELEQSSCVRPCLPPLPRGRVCASHSTAPLPRSCPGYFGGCPVVRVPGFTHPVEDFYLENILQLTGARLPACVALCGWNAPTLECTQSACGRF